MPSDARIRIVASVVGRDHFTRRYGRVTSDRSIDAVFVNVNIPRCIPVFVTATACPEPVRNTDPFGDDQVVVDVQSSTMFAAALVAAGSASSYTSTSDRANGWQTHSML